MINVWALVSVIIFYLLILGVGIWASRKNKASSSSEDMMVAGRNMGVFVGILSTTGTVMRPGLVLLRSKLFRGICSNMGWRRIH